jgi:fumarate reductase flavoprotein subunit
LFGVECLVEKKKEPVKKSPATGKLFCISLFLLISLGGCDTPTTETHLFTPGTYKDSSQGYMNPVNVTVAFSKDAIESVVIDADHKQSTDCPEVADAIVQIPRRIYGKQSLKVDTVSGATFTSRAIIVAVEKCVKQAGGDEAVAKLKETGN